MPRSTAADTAKNKARFLEEYERIGGRGKSLAAKNIGMDRTTIYLWQREDVKFKEAMDLAAKRCNQVIENVLFERAKKGEAWAVSKWLDNRMSDEWQDKRNLNVTGKLSNDVKITNLQQLLDAYSGGNGNGGNGGNGKSKGKLPGGSEEVPG